MSLDLEEIKPADSSDGSVFSSVISVLQGAFRFTTGLFGADEGREIQINLGTTTIGIRGTDVWGKSTRDRNFVVLIEGQIEVQNQSDSPLTMDQPLTLFDTPKSQDPLPVTTVEPNQLSAWAKETELEPGHGILTENGPYLVYLTSSQNVTYAEQAGQELRELGYPAEFYFANVNGNNWVRIGIKGFFTVDDAQYFKQRIAEDLGISGAWIVRQ